MLRLLQKVPTSEWDVVHQHRILGAQTIEELTCWPGVTDHRFKHLAQRGKKALALNEQFRDRIRCRKSGLPVWQ